MPEAVIRSWAPKETYIGQLDILAAICAYTSLPGKLRDAEIIHWIDNTSALASLVRGYSSKPDSATLVNAFHALNVGLRSNVWFEYVPSKANISDLPSRDDFDALIRELGRTGKPIEHVECVLPAVDGDDWASFLSAALGAGGGIRARKRRGSSVGGRRNKPR